MLNPSPRQVYYTYLQPSLVCYQHSIPYCLVGFVCLGKVKVKVKKVNLYSALL